MNGLQAYEKFKIDNVIPVIWEKWFLDIVCKDGKWQVSYYEKDGLVLGIYIYYLKQKLGFSYITMPPALKYMGPIFSPLLKSSEYKLAYDYMLGQIENVSSFEQQWQVETKEILDEHLSEIDFQTRETYYLDLSISQDELLANMNNNYRRSIVNNNLEINYINTNKNSIKQFIKCLEVSMGALRNHSISEIQLTELIIEAEKLKKGKLILCEYNKEIIGGSFVVFNHKTAYYLYAGNHKEFNKLYPGVQIAWKTIEFLKKETNIELLDFYGSSIESVAKVWDKLGAQKMLFPVINKRVNGLFNLLQMTKKLIKKID